MKLPGVPVKGTWWRFSAYVIQDGYIRPAPHAELQKFDPWEAYWENHGIKGAREFPFQSLSALVARASYSETVSRVRAYDGPARRPLNEAECRAITDWCSKFGLLGLLFEQVMFAKLPVRWSSDDYVRNEQHGVLLGEGYMARQPTFSPILHMRGSWANVEIVDYVSREQAAGQLVTGRAFNDKPAPLEIARRYPPVLIARRGPATGQVLGEQRPFGSVWPRYFPDVPAGEEESFPYPVPQDGEWEKFWAQYAEPVEEFLNFAYWLWETLRSLALVRERKQEKRSAKYWESTGEGELAFLNALASSAQPNVTLREDGSFHQDWAALSLASNIGLMIMHSLSNGARVRYCAGCQSIYVNNAYQSRWCGDNCRWRMDVRARREREKKAKKAAEAD